MGEVGCGTVGHNNSSYIAICFFKITKLYSIHYNSGHLFFVAHLLKMFVKHIHTYSLMVEPGLGLGYVGSGSIFHLPSSVLHYERPEQALGYEHPFFQHTYTVYINIHTYTYIYPKMIISNFDYRILCLPYHCSKHFRDATSWYRKTGYEWEKDPAHCACSTHLPYLNFYGSTIEDYPFFGRLCVRWGT